MDREQADTLTLEQAKARLREATRRSTPLDLVQANPREALLLALLAGAVFGATPQARNVMIKSLFKLVLD